jgi:hypothetical protein
METAIRAYAVRKYIRALIIVYQRKSAAEIRFADRDKVL